MGVLCAKIGEGVVRYWPLTNSFFLLRVLMSVTNFGENRSRKATVRVLADGQIHKLTCSTVVVQCYRRQAVPTEQAKIRTSVTLYSLDRSFPNLVWLIMSATTTHMPILVKFGSLWNITSLWLFVVSLFSSNRLAKKRVNGFTRIMAQNAWNQTCMCLLGVSSNNGHPHPSSHKFRKFCITKAVFRLNTYKYFSKRPKIRRRIGNSPWGFQILGKSLTGSSFMAVSAHAQQKIG